MATDRNLSRRRRGRWLFKVEDRYGYVRGVWGTKALAKRYRDDANMRYGKPLYFVHRGPEHHRGETGRSRHERSPTGGWFVATVPGEGE